MTREESDEALELGFEALRTYLDGLRARGRAVLEELEREGRVGVVMLARPYHNEPELNHEIMSEIQKRGYPIFSIDSLPQDADILERLFGDELRSGVITDPLDVTDVWKNAYSENSSKKVWAAKYIARHPNLVAVDLSSFKCGHDAPIYDPPEHIVEATGTPSASTTSTRTRPAARSRSAWRRSTTSSGSTRSACALAIRPSGRSRSRSTPTALICDAPVRPR